MRAVRVFQRKSLSQQQSMREIERGRGSEKGLIFAIKTLPRKPQMSSETAVTTSCRAVAAGNLSARIGYVTGF